jgi:hypothetical protein
MDHLGRHLRKLVANGNEFGRSFVVPDHFREKGRRE